MMLCGEVFNDLKGLLRVGFSVSSGRFLEEENLEVYIAFKDVKKRLLAMKVFHGKPPYYRRWVEVFMIKKELTFNDVVFKFIDSTYERKIIECLSKFLKNGERLFIEYMYDDETKKALELSVPPPLTRLGYILLQNGFTWFKDWYYPEGFMEGGPKLQAEKPIGEESKKKHIDELCREVEKSVDMIRDLANLREYSWIMNNVLKRIDHVLRICDPLPALKDGAFEL
ncbi:MAG: DUF1122 family protein [Sulfolobales archaeon]